jgi:hypothetical protein
MLQSGPKLTLGLLATITLEVGPFRVYAPFSLQLNAAFTTEETE